jgi:rhodanese-related sulfurtransferase
MTSIPAASFFAAKLAFQTDVTDVHTALAAGDLGFVLVDSRGTAAWEQGRIPGALHLPTDRIPEQAPGLLDPATPARRLRSRASATRSGR